MKDIKNLLALLSITLFLIIGSDVLFKSFPSKEQQQLLFNYLIKVLMICYVVIVSSLGTYEYIRNKKLTKEKRSYTTTFIVAGMMIITLLITYIFGFLFEFSL